MAIDGRIKSITVDGANLILELESRDDSLVGQEKLTILDFMFQPEVGDEVWGGSSTVHIERKNKRQTLHYKREGYAKLREDLDYGFRQKQSSRFA